MVVTVEVVLLVATVFGAVFYSAYHRSISDDVRSTGSNALWLGHAWVGETHTAADYDELAELLRANEITDALFHVGPIEADGTIPTERFPNAGELATELHYRLPELRVQAWMGQNEAARGGPLDLDDVEARARIMATAGRFLDLGFDGIHYNIEPIFPGDQRFLDLLAATRRLTERRGAVLSTATMELEPVRGAAWFGRRVISRYHAWTPDYLVEVAELVDQVAVMTYDSAAPTDWLYGALVREQTSTLARRIEDDAQVFIGIPSYGDPNLGHWPEAENVRSGVRGVRLGLADVDEADRAQIGIAIYAEWTTTAEEWRTYQRDWLRTPPTG